MELVIGPRSFGAMEVNMSVTMTILLSLSLFASFIFVARSGDARRESTGHERDDCPTGFEFYV